MAVATIKLLKPEYIGNFFMASSAVEFAKTLMREGLYETVGSLGIPSMEGEDVAEEVFDLTNNPGRDDERADVYGRGRSVSTGDIVNVDGVDYLCCSVGWRRL